MDYIEIKKQLDILKTFTGDSNELSEILTNYKSLLEEKLEKCNFIDVQCEWMDNACSSGFDGINIYINILTGRIFTNDELFNHLKPILDSQLGIKPADKEIKVYMMDGDESETFNVQEIYQYLKDRIIDTPYKEYGSSYQMKMRILFDNQGLWPDNTHRRNELRLN